MNASELSRKLLYCGYSDVTDYLKRGPVERFLYKRLIEIVPMAEIDVPVVNILNELYYQCARIQYDHTPGTNVQKRYLEESAAWLDSVSASQLVFCLVRAFLKRKRKLSFNEECFDQSLCPFLNACMFLGLAKDLVHFMELNRIFAPEEFETMTCPIYQLPEKIGNEYYYYHKRPFSIWFKRYFGQIVEPETIVVNPWAEVTDNYSYSVIESYIKLYHLKEEQLELLKRIEKSCNDDDRTAHSDDFSRIRSNISSDEYLHIERVTDYGYDSQEEYDLMFAAGYNQTMEEAGNDKEEQYKQERDTFKYQLDQLKKNYESDLARLESEYQKEIEQLKEELAQESKEQAKVTTEDSTQTNELTFTVTEIANDAKQWFHESGALEITNLLYRLAKKHQNYDDGLWDLIGSITPAVERRTTPHQTVEIPHAGQVNISPQQVNNYSKEAER